MSAAPPPPAQQQEPSSHSKFTIAFAKHIGNEVLARMPEISRQMQANPSFASTMGCYLTFRWNPATGQPQAMIDVIGTADIVTVPLAFDGYGELGIGAPPSQQAQQQTQTAPPPQERFQHPPQAAAGGPTGAGVPIYNQNAAQVPHSVQSPVPADQGYPSQGPPAGYSQQPQQPQQPQFAQLWHPAQDTAQYPGVTVQQEPLFDPYTGAPLQASYPPPPPPPPGWEHLPVPGSSTAPGVKVRLNGGGMRRNPGKMPQRRQLADDPR